MNNHSANHDKEKQRTDEAWTRLQETLAGEPMNHKWAEWDQKAEAAKLETLKQDGYLSGADYHKAEELGYAEQQDPVTGSSGDRSRSRRPKMNRRRKWGIAAASITIVAAILATPVGNTAMAAILNQFRIQSVTVVNEDDLRNMFNSVSENGDLKETINKFGSFSSSSGTISGKIKPEQVKNKLGYAPLSTALSDNGTELSVYPSTEVTLNLNVKEVNKAMKRLGAEQLLPESIDGKPITLHIPETVNYNLSPDSAHWANLTQMNTPVITVDPSIKVEEALETVINFPLLPDSLKSSLKQSSILAGEVPIPLITQEHTEQVTVEGTKVFVSRYEYGQDTAYNAVWIHNGQLFELSSGNIYTTKEKITAKVQELIQS
ncbi:hypothetical protein [Paenibacillus durus]|uniref:DUF4367 domain-containing protein n=1 Tax=Paenibacillus durus ATCC 35681 TaxID=1333534 RepID=A0A0F7F9Y9_PAEDU|nr:hypothetical protein [Paenibacillus durus]AKG34754.1 hypothetical protein VK70_09370 [Paenibacillus durus ATCC 35681]